MVILGVQRAADMPPLLDPIGLDGDLFIQIGYSHDAAEAEDFHAVALQNLGNTCYLNALLHAVARLPSVRSWSAQHQSFCAFSHGSPGVCALCDLAYDLNSITEQITEEAVAPRSVIKRAVWGGHRFDNLLQHDASEAFTVLFSACDAIDVHAARDLQPPGLLLEDSISSVRYSTPYYRTFGGLSLSILKCNKCQYISRKREIFHCLTVEVPAEDSIIEQVISDHWGTQELKDVGDYCRECGESQCQQRNLQLDRWPRVLVLHLKRWKVTSLNPFRQEKRYTKVSFGEILPVPGKSLPYYLRAVVVHHGEAGGGHYTALVRSADHQWYHCNDFQPPCWASPETVTGADTVPEKNAYMLFYEE